MKRERLWKHLAITFATALGLYILGFSWLEHRRSRLGPWEVTFLRETASAPLVLINQPALQITNVQIQFDNTSDVALTNLTVEFTPGRDVPFPVPFGECVFMDPLFLPGTVTLNVLDHQIQMLPRSLSIDGREHEWVSGTLIRVTTAR